MTLKEVAETLNLNYQTVFNWVKEGKLEAYRVGSGWRVTESQLNKLIEKREAK